MNGKNKNGKIIEIVQLASKNRMTIPKKIRDFYHLKKGNYVAFIRNGDDIIFSLLSEKYIEGCIEGNAETDKMEQLKKEKQRRELVDTTVKEYVSKFIELETVVNELEKSKKEPPKKNSSHLKILQVLNDNSLTGMEIAELTGLSYDGIRGRISELNNKLGYKIEYDEKNKTYALKQG